MKVISNALCHTDIYTLDGHDPEVGSHIFLKLDEISFRDSSRASLVMRLRLLLSRLVMESPVYRCLLSYLCQRQIHIFSKMGDVVIPCYTPECKDADCIFCASPKTNLCPKIR